MRLGAACDFAQRTASQIGTEFTMDATTKSKRKAIPASADPILPRGYPDLHDHIQALDEAGLLVTVDRPINKDTEMHPLVRWQFRAGIQAQNRKAFLFTTAAATKNRTSTIP